MDTSSHQLSLNIDSVGRALAQWVVTRMEEDDATLPQRYGFGWRSRWIADMQVRISHLAQAVAVQSPELFRSTVMWSQAAYMARSVDLQDLRNALRCLLAVLESEMPDNVTSAVLPYVQQALVAVMEESPPSAEPHVSMDRAHGKLSLLYLEALLDGRRADAERLILDAAEAGVPITELYEDVLRVTQLEVGQMWHMDEITVADEHFATATTDSVISQLRRFFPDSTPRGRRMVATTVGGDLHALGVRMVADFFEMDGWNVFYLGPNTPNDAMADVVQVREAHLLALSGASVLHVRALAELIRQLRDNDATTDVKVIVGGPIFLMVDGLWRSIGADGFASTATEAVAVGNALLDEYMIASDDHA
ncbi:MAG: cobalamin-dependent protein [Planctomycetota bacterium]